VAWDRVLPAHRRCGTTARTTSRRLSPLVTDGCSTTHGPAARRPKQAGTRRQPPHPPDSELIGTDARRPSAVLAPCAAGARRSFLLFVLGAVQQRKDSEVGAGTANTSTTAGTARQQSSSSRAQDQQQAAVRSPRALLPRPWLQSCAAPAPSFPRAWQHWLEPSLSAHAPASQQPQSSGPSGAPTRPISAPAVKCVEQQSASRRREARLLVSLSPLAARHEALLASPTTNSSPARLIEHRHARTSAATLGTRLDPRRQREREARDRGGPSSLGLVQARVALLLEVPHARASHLRASSSHRHRFVPRTRSQPHPGWSGRSGIFSSRLAARSVLLLPFHAVSARQISATHLEPDPEHTGGSSLGPA
jgi:hypothetical protein